MTNLWSEKVKSFRFSPLASTYILIIWEKRIEKTDLFEIFSNTCYGIRSIHVINTNIIQIQTLCWKRQWGRWLYAQKILYWQAYNTPIPLYQSHLFQGTYNSSLGPRPFNPQKSRTNLKYKIKCLIPITDTMISFKQLRNFKNYHWKQPTTAF